MSGLMRVALMFSRGEIRYSYTDALFSLFHFSVMYRGHSVTNVFRFSFIAGLLSLGLVFGSAAHAQGTDKGTDTILVLDASGSMWGVVDGQTKISAARQAVDSILSKWRPSDRLGVIAYGHRSKGDCKDIELLVPVSTFDPAKIKTAVDGLNPKGKTPIADSLRAAAAALRSTENKATVILVSDGIETCAPDPCAVAAELKKSGVGFTAHVIGFDVADPLAKNQLQCIARATGGVYLDARNASGLEGALTKAVDATRGTKVASEAPAKAVPVEDVYAGKNIRGVVRLAAGLDPVSDKEVSWGIFKRRGDEQGDMVTTFYGAPLADSVAPGDYILVIGYGQLKREFPLKVEKGKPAIIDAVLDAGYVTSEGSVTGAGKAIDVTWQMTDKGGNVVATEYDPVPRFVLGAGDYVLSLTKGQSKTTKAFTLAAGDSINVSLALDVGKLIVTATYSPGGPKVETGLTVQVKLPPKLDGDDAEKVATEYEAQSQFDLPTGSYDVVATVGEASRTVRADVKSGAPTRLTVNLDAGVVGVKTGGAEEIDIYGAERDLNDERKRVFVQYDSTLNLALNVGEYVAVAQYPGGKTVEKAFTITAGKRQQVDIQPQP